MQKLFNMIKMLLLGGVLLVACQSPMMDTPAVDTAPPKSSTPAPAQEKKTLTVS